MPLSRKELDAFLGEPRLCHFATVDPTGRPRVRPLWYLWRDEAFWFTTRLEARHTGRDVQAGSATTISIASEERPYRAVIAHGVPDDHGKDEALLRAISTRYGEREGLRWLAHAMKQDDRTVLRMRPGELLSWDYGRGDSARQERGVSMRTRL
jgi:nitroimidazol reductase NimA-like FMN-containing flavoprotein (pyridoxamine 5'-phosphate oxidase superfamily)